MKQIRLILIVTFASIIFSWADLPKSLEGQLTVDVSQALTKNGERPSTAEVEDAIREGSTQLQLNPGALAEYESQESSISAVVLQEVISDFEQLAGDLAVPKMISFYIAKSKLEVLTSRQRILCYVMIKSAMRHIRTTQKEQ